MIIPNMGTSVASLAKSSLPGGGLANALFTPVQQRVLGLLFGQPDRRFQSAELIRMADSGTGAVHRLLTRLADAGLVSVERAGNQKYYQANRTSPVFAELHGLVVKTSGLLEPLRKALASFGDHIVAAFVYGSLANGTDRASSDVDLMVIAEGIEYADLFAVLQPVETEIGRGIQPNLMSLQDWRRKRQQKGFVARIAVGATLFVMGSEDDLV